MRLYLNERRDADLVRLFACLVRPSPQELVREVMDCTIHDLPLPQPLIDPESEREPRTSFTIRLTSEEETYLSAFPKGQKSNVVRILLRHALWDVCLSFLTTEQPMQKVTKQSPQKTVRKTPKRTTQKPRIQEVPRQEQPIEERNPSLSTETERQERKPVVEESVQESTVETEPMVETERPSLTTSEGQSEGQDEQTLADQSLDLFNNIIGGE